MDSCRIGAGVTLAIDSGIVVKFLPAKYLWVQGILDARGTPGSPVVFTSVGDDAFGGDVTGDGRATLPRPDDWDFLRIDDSRVELKHCIVRYAMNGIFACGSSPSVHDCAIDYCSSAGILCRNSDSIKIRDNRIDSCAVGIDCGATGVHSRPIISGNRVTRAWRAGMNLKDCEPAVEGNHLTGGAAFPIVLEGYVKPAFSRNVFSGNRYRAFGLHGIAVAPGALEYRLFDVQNLGWPYVVIDNYAVAENASLIIDPGIVVKLMPSNYFRVQGALTTRGSAERPVLFTSFYDDGFGGDANGDGAATAPKAGDWDCLRIDGGGSELSRCIVRYATKGVYSCNCSPAVHDCIVENAQAYGLLLQGCNSEINRLAVLDCPVGVGISLGAPAIVNSLLSGCKTGVAIEGRGEAAALASINNCNFSGIRDWYIAATGAAADRRVNATGNWFGSADARSIASKMREDKATIDWGRFASSPVSSAWVRGDFTLDGRVDGVDLSVLAGAFGASPGDPGYLPLCDLFTGAPDRIDGFDLARFGMDFGKSGIAVSKRVLPGGDSPNLAFLPPLTPASGDTYAVPLVVRGKTPLRAVAFDMIMPQGCAVLGIDRHEAADGDANDAAVLAAIVGNRSVIGMTRLDAGAFVCGDTLGIVRFRKKTGPPAGEPVTLENGAFFYVSGETASVPYALLRLTRPLLPAAIDVRKPDVNPTSGRMRISYQLPLRQRVRLELFTLQGKRVAVPVDDVRDPGYYSLSWKCGTGDGPLPSGCYVLTFTAQEYRRCFGVHIAR
jgi:hypothetical protein